LKPGLTDSQGNAVPSGTVEIPRGKAALRENAVPCIFPENKYPKYLNNPQKRRSAPTARGLPLKRKKPTVVVQESVQKRKELSTIQMT